MQFRTIFLAYIKKSSTFAPDLGCIPINDLIFITMKAKPFVKWVGGKTQLIEQLEALLPADFDQWENVTYIEPFVGGGVMLFYMLQT